MKIFAFETNLTSKVRLLGHVKFTEPWLHFTRTSNEYIMYFVESGELHIKEGNTEYSLRKGDMLLLEPDIEHSGFKESVCHYYYIHFKAPDFLKVADRTVEDILKESLINRQLSLTSEIDTEEPPYSSTAYLPKYYHFENESEIMKILVEADYDFYLKYEHYKTIVSLRFMEIIIKMCIAFINKSIDTSQNHFSTSYNIVKDIIRYLKKNYNNELSSNEIEILFEYNYDYLNRVFKKITGHTIMNYLNHLRITKAKDLICETTMKFSEIGYLVGIDNQYYFSKLFKKYTGLTPSQFAKNRFDIGQT